MTLKALTSRLLLALSFGIVFLQASLVCPQEQRQDIGGGVVISDKTAEFPPFSRKAIDYLFDSLRSGSVFNLPPSQQSQEVPNNIAGIWAGVKVNVESNVGVITLRFRPSDEARLEQAQSNKGGALLAESFDIEVELKRFNLIIRHKLAESNRTRMGMVVEFEQQRPNPVLTEFVKAYRDAGAYFSLPPLTRDLANKAWALLICPRTPKLFSVKGRDETRLELHKSRYELREVNFSVATSAQARIPPTDKPERINVKVLATGNLPVGERNSDEVSSLAPNIEVLYRPQAPFDFFKVPLVSGGVQEGLLSVVETENAARYIRKQYQSHIVYVQRLSEPSPVPVIIGDYRAVRDDGDCYVLAVQREVWNQYGRREVEAGS